MIHLLDCDSAEKSLCATMHASHVAVVCILTQSQLTNRDGLLYKPFVLYYMNLQLEIKFRIDLLFLNDDQENSPKIILLPTIPFLLKL